jgi:hypothetical protein
VFEGEDWPFTLDLPFSACNNDGEGPNDCPFDEDNPDNPCNAEECADGAHESDACRDYAETYCANTEDYGCYHEDDGRDVENLAVKVEMNSLEEWLVKIEGEYPLEMSDEIRHDVANMCADMLETSNSEITQTCFTHVLEMMENDDDYGDDYGDDHGCPPDLTEDECSAFEDCEDNGMTMSCMRMMYNYCKDNPMFVF